MYKIPMFSLSALCAVLACQANAEDAVEAKEGFIQGSSLNILNRNFYINRDYRKGQSDASGDSYSEAWAQAAIARFESGFTAGTVGFGFDAFAMVGLKLDSGKGRYGPGGSINVMPVNDDGRADDEYVKAGGALKARLFDTVINVGDVSPYTPVLAAGDSRLLPESFKGFTVTNTSIDKLTLMGGRVHAMSQPQDTSLNENFATFYAGPVDSPWAGYVGGNYELNKNLTLGLYTGRLKDAWDQHYFGVNYSYPINDNLALFADFNYYNATDEGKRLLGEFSNNIFSGRIGATYGPHTLAFSAQKNNGSDDFDYLRQSDSIYLNNSIQYSDFNSPKEKSWMVSYQIDMGHFGVPGLTLMTRYAQGRDADYSGANDVYMRRDGDGNPLSDQKRWERDLEAKYVVRSGTLKDASFRLRQATTRATAFESDLDEIRLIVEYPLSVL